MYDIKQISTIIIRSIYSPVKKIPFFPLFLSLFSSLLFLFFSFSVTYLFYVTKQPSYLISALSTASPSVSVFLIFNLFLSSLSLRPAVNCPFSSSSLDVFLPPQFIHVKRHLVSQIATSTRLAKLDPPHFYPFPLPLFRFFLVPANFTNVAYNEYPVYIRRIVIKFPLTSDTSDEFNFAPVRPFDPVKYHPSFVIRNTVPITPCINENKRTPTRYRMKFLKSRRTLSFITRIFLSIRILISLVSLPTFGKFSADVPLTFLVSTRIHFFFSENAIYNYYFFE